MPYNNILETIGNTPLVRLNRLPPAGSATIYCKLESFNPMRSVKDRVALAMIEDAETRGKLRPGMEVVVVEPTSGNTGIGLAMVCAVKGYKLVLTMPESFSVERRKLLLALGAELVLTPRTEGMQGAVDCAKGICKERPDAFMPQQFDNPANPKKHMETTALEILSEIPSPDDHRGGQSIPLAQSENANCRRRASSFAVTFRRQGGSAWSPGARGELHTINLGPQRD
jgi:cysteine synthase A